MYCFVKRIIVAASLVLVLQPPCLSQDDTSHTAFPTVPRRVIATVNDAELLEAELAARLWQMPQPADSKVSVNQRALVRKALIQQHLVLEYLRRRGQSATAKDVSVAYEKWQADLAKQRLTPSEYFRRTGYDESSIRRKVEWQVAWPRFEKRKLTEKTLKKYFHDHQSEFDGTRLRVAHILWKTDDRPIPASLLAEAKATYASLTAGKLSFTDAVEQYSTAPSAGNDGLVGWIQWNGPMHPQFTRAAFELMPQECSKPLKTPHGVHIIQCLERESGTRNFEQVKEQVREAARKDMFKTMTRRERKLATIKLIDAS